MSKYDVVYTSSFYNSARRLDKETQRRIKRWIEKHLIGVDFPTSPGKVLTGELAGHVRFRIGDFRLIAKVNNKVLQIYALYVDKRSVVYKFRPDGV
ncbi:MAG: type II toxin-antitoxin system RelE/ParE family toxin [Lactobacillales bacterium]|jgi:mRNA interferase RelE/StbE|nr:type II toxin-antitoxin system RelE/ParE family toxin [Lactobacillales bacterium]